MSSERKLRVEQLEAENAALRERLDLQLTGTANFEDVDAWELSIGQKTRDELAVRAIFLHSGDMYHALRYLGFTLPENRIEQRALAKKVFDTPGVRALMEQNLAELEGHREKIIARQIQISLFGTNEDATRSAQLLARIGGWQKQPENSFERGAVNVNVLLGERAAAKEISVGMQPVAALLSHEPGPPVRIDSEVTREIEG